MRIKKGNQDRDRRRYWAFQLWWMSEETETDERIDCSILQFNFQHGPHARCTMSKQSTHRRCDAISSSKPAKGDMYFPKEVGISQTHEEMKLNRSSRPNRCGDIRFMWSIRVVLGSCISLAIPCCTMEEAILSDNSVTQHKALNIYYFCMSI